MNVNSIPGIRQSFHVSTSFSLFQHCLDRIQQGTCALCTALHGYPRSATQSLVYKINVQRVLYRRVEGMVVGDIGLLWIGNAQCDWAPTLIPY